MTDKDPETTTRNSGTDTADLSAEGRYARSPQADSTLAGDRAALYHRHTRTAVTLNRSGTVLWQAMDVPRTRAELGRVLQEQWPGLPDDTARADVAAFISEMQTQGFCEEV